MFGSRTPRIRRARLVPIALTTAALSSAVLGASVTGTLSAFNASITNTANTATSGSLVMQEVAQDGSTTCLSSSGSNNNFTSCSTINKYGGDVYTPGAAHQTSVTIANTGSASVSDFEIRPGVCTKTDLNGTSNTGSLCESLLLNLTCSAASSNGVYQQIYSATSLKDIASADKPIPSACFPGPNGANPVRFVFTLSLPSSTGSSVQSQQVSQPLTWTFTGA